MRHDVGVDARVASGFGSRRVAITGAGGYLGRALSRALLDRRHTVLGLTRAGSVSRLVTGVTPIVDDALDAASYAESLHGTDTLVHLVGTPRPNPFKAAAFERVDLASVRAAIAAARHAGIAHLVYVSVAQPAPVMRAYVAARAAAEALVRASGFNATILRPWYVLGPGHRWPHLLRPAYWVLERLPITADTAQRLGLITLAQMTRALVAAVERPARGIEVFDVAGIKNLSPP